VKTHMKLIAIKPTLILGREWRITKGQSK